MLHAIEGRNRWCGPAALAAVAGVTTDTAAAVLRGVTGKRAIKGVSRVAMRSAWERLGYVGE